MATLQHFQTRGLLESHGSFETLDACDTRKTLDMSETLAILEYTWNTRNVRNTNNRITRHTRNKRPLDTL
eukprot:6255325-Lingulodinium_polyedra.AAC.1